jgi:hypothetical protein
MCLQFGFVIFWRKDFGTKAAHKMLVKLTQGRHPRSLFDARGNGQLSKCQFIKKSTSRKHQLRPFDDFNVRFDLLVN